MQVMTRYHVAMAKGGRAAFEAAIDEDKGLLEFHGLRLLSVDGCIRAAVLAELKGKRVNPWNVIELSPKAWDFLRPILVAARDMQVQAQGNILSLAAK